jgi:phosphoglycolate phosphatase-like HAD superfamily hydrolase
MSEDIKAVFFDHDDTLVGTIAAKWAHHKHVARTWYGKELTDDDIRQHWGVPFSKLVELLYGQDDPEEAMRRNLSCEDDFPKVLPAETVPTLQRLHDAGKVLGIITATSRYSFEHDLDLHGFPRDIIDYTQTEDDTSFHKPDPRVFEPAIAWLAARRILPREVLYVADGLHDMKAAAGAGFNFMGVTTGLVTSGEFAAAGAESVQNLSLLLPDVTAQKVI